MLCFCWSQISLVATCNMVVSASLTHDVHESSHADLWCVSVDPRSLFGSHVVVSVTLTHDVHESSHADLWHVSVDELDPRSFWVPNGFQRYTNTWHSWITPCWVMPCFCWSQSVAGSRAPGVWRPVCSWFTAQGVQVMPPRPPSTLCWGPRWRWLTLPLLLLLGR